MSKYFVVPDFDVWSVHRNVFLGTFVSTMYVISFNTKAEADAWVDKNEPPEGEDGDRFIEASLYGDY